MTTSVNDENVAVRLALHGAADAVAEQTREQVRLTRPDNDEIGVALFGEAQDLVGCIAEPEHCLHIHAAISQDRASASLLLAVHLGRVPVLESPDPVNLTLSVGATLVTMT